MKEFNGYTIKATDNGFDIFCCGIEDIAAAKDVHLSGHASTIAAAMADILSWSEM